MHLLSFLAKAPFIWIADRVDNLRGNAISWLTAEDRKTIMLNKRIKSITLANQVDDKRLLFVTDLKYPITNDRIAIEVYRDADNGQFTFQNAMFNEPGRVISKKRKDLYSGSFIPKELEPLILDLECYSSYGGINSGPKECETIYELLRCILTMAELSLNLVELA